MLGKGRDEEGEFSCSRIKRKSRLESMEVEQVLDLSLHENSKKTAQNYIHFFGRRLGLV